MTHWSMALFRSSPWVGAGILATIPACTAPDPGPGETRETVVRDSAGVAIVEVPLESESRAPEWTVADTPELELGVRDGEGPELFSGIRGLVRLADGGVGVLDGGARELRFFSGDGTHRITLAGPGEGPGELRLPQGLFPLEGDTVAVWDWGDLLRFHPDDGLVDSRSVDPAAGTVVGVTSGHRVLGRSSTLRLGQAEAGAVERDQQVFQIVTAGEAAAPDTLAVFGDHRLVMVPLDRALQPQSVPFTVEASAAASAGKIAVTPGTRRELRYFDASGRLERIVRIGGESELLPEGRFDEAITRRIEAWPEEIRPVVRRHLEGVPAPSSLPAYTGLIVGEDGSTWARHFQEGLVEGVREVQTERWTVFEPDGRVRAVVRLPTGFTPWQTGADWVLGVQEDQLGVEHVHLLRLIPVES